MSLKIYTRTGDKGETSLFGGKRVSKASLRVDAYGTVDELNSVLGVVVSHFKKKSPVKEELLKIQHDLFTIGSVLATPPPSKRDVSSLTKRIDEFERLIDHMTEKMPELRNFILPSGSIAGSFLHQARSVCRRAERRITELTKKETVDDNILKYFNRLSDLLFTMARFINHKERKKETIWNKTI